MSATFLKKMRSLFAWASPKKKMELVAPDSELVQEHAYRLSFLKQALRALGAAKQTYVRMNEVGMLCVQHLIEPTVPAGARCYVDFLICTEEDGGGERDEGGHEGA